MGPEGAQVIDVFAVLYLVGGALILGTELYCVFTRNKQTVSHKLIRWMKGNPTTRRLIVGAFLVWLMYHFLIEYF